MIGLINLYFYASVLPFCFTGYAELVTELNLLPVRSDTLKIRNRKIEIENQLKKLDEGIKVFTRPKVFVKIGA